MGVILDISKWQQDPDFVKLGALYKNGTIDGVIIRVQHGYTIPDEKYTQYVAGCKANGIPFGTYAYAAPISTNDAIAEANSAFQRTDKESKCFAVDIEEKDCPDIVAAGQAYIDRLHELGMVHVGKYSYTGFYNANNLAAIKADWTWVAAYGVNDGTPHVQPNVDGIDLWQFTSTARVDGISTNVDESEVTDPNGFPFFNRTVVAPAPPAPKDNPTKYPVRPVSTGNPVVAEVEVIVDSLNCRQHPDANSPVLFVAKKGQRYNVTANINDWHEVIIDNDGYNGYLFGNKGTYLSLVHPQPQPQPVQHTYTVQAGDTLSAIAAKLGVSQSELQNLNGITNPNLIFAGQVLHYNTSASTPVPAPTTRTVFLPASNDTWTVYHLNSPCIKAPANIAGELAPKRFGGLTYTILKDFGNYEFEIATQSFGHVKIYAAPSTGAIVR